LISVQIDSLGKKFGSEWIFRNIFFEISPNDKVVVLGGNGSGKSTLLQILSGFVTPNEGAVSYSLNNIPVEESKLKDHVSFASPYLQLVDDFTLLEMVEHATVFKPFKNKLSVKDVIALIELDHAKNKFVRQLSSGMRQRLKLGLAILADTPLLLLDEPVSNLDRDAINWYKSILQKYSEGRTIIVCSNNIEDEYFLCKRSLDVMDFKPKKQPF
jgi:ABC-type multidrug transport system ATPase subunit